MMRHSRRHLAGLLLAVMVIALAMTGAPAHVSADHTVAGRARGQAIEIRAGPVTIQTPPADSAGITADVATAISEINSGGIGVGTHLVARGSATPAFLDADPLGSAVVARSATSAPPGGTETDDVPDAGPFPAPFEFFSASALRSESTAGTSPLSRNLARVAEAHVTPSSPALADASVLEGFAEARRDGAAADSTAHARADVVTVTVGEIAIVVEEITATADARATGTLAGPDPSAAGASCVVKRITAPLIGTLEPIDCEEAADIVIGPITIAFGNTAGPVVSEHAASVGIDAVTILLGGTPIAILGSAHASAELATPEEAPSCGDPLPPPTPSGSAQGLLVGADTGLPSPGDGRADVVRSDARIDEKGLSEPSAKGDAWIGRGQAFTPPADIAVVDAHAKAPPAESDTNYAASISSPITAAGAKTTAEASTAGPGTLLGPRASASAEVASLDAAPSPLAISDLTASSNARSDRNPGDVTSHGEANAETLTLSSSAGPALLTVHALHTSADAVATGIPGGATTATHFDFVLATLAVDGLPPLEITPSAPSPISVGPVTLAFGVSSTSTSPDGSTADASMDAIVLDIDGGPHVVVGHSEAHARVPSSGLISVDLDIHFDAPFTFGDSGGTTAPHQKMCKAIVFGNNTGQTFTGVVITDTLDPNLRAVPPLPAGMTQSGQTVTASVGTLAPGQGGSFTFLIEVIPDAPLGRVIQNRATLDANEIAPVTSDPVSVTVGIDPDQPALFISHPSNTFDPGTRVLTSTVRVNDRAGAGKAFGVVIDQIITKPPTVTVLTALPIPVGDIDPGTFRLVTVQFHVPSGVTSFNAIFREVGFGPDGHRYAFD